MRPCHFICKVAATLLAGSLVAGGCGDDKTQSSVTSPVSKQDAASQDGGETGNAAAVDSALLCGGVVCLAGEHLDTHSCGCVPNLPQDAGPTELAPPVECGGMLCPVGDRLDLRLCKCVNTFDANLCGGVFCGLGYHFDKGLCECVPDTSSSDASSSDASSSDASSF
jgi:hypothetical protein